MFDTRYAPLDVIQAVTHLRMNFSSIRICCWGIALHSSVSAACSCTLHRCCLWWTCQPSMSQACSIRYMLSLATQAILVLCGWALSCWNDRRARCCSENGTSAGRAKNNQIRDGAPTDMRARSNSPTWVDSIVAWWRVVQTLLFSSFLWCETIGLRMQ